MASFDFVRKKIKSAFRRDNKKSQLFNHGYSSGEIGRSYFDPGRKVSYDVIAHGVRSLVIDMYQKLINYYESLGYDKAQAKQVADQVISYRVDPIAKEAEKDEASARDFYEKVVAMYKEFKLPLPKSDLHYYPKKESI